MEQAFLDMWIYSALLVLEPSLYLADPIRASFNSSIN
jgi:hypothetical protein